MINESLSLEIWERLSQGKSFDGLSLGSNNGRVDLRGLSLSEPSILRRYHTKVAAVTEIETRSVHAAKWHSLDFTGSKLSGLRLLGCEISNCLFDNCELRDLRVWSTTFSDCSFKAADLRMAMLGGVQDHSLSLFFAKAYSRPSFHTV